MAALMNQFSVAATKSLGDDVEIWDTRQRHRSTS